MAAQNVPKAAGDEHVDLYPYPPSFPSSAVWRIAADAFKGIVPDAKTAFHATWHVGGYMAGQWDVHNPPPFGGKAETPTKEQAAAFCESMAADGLKAPEATGWITFLPLVLDLVKNLWDMWNKK